QRNVAYELLYRASVADSACIASKDLAAARVLTDAFMTMDLATLTLGLPAFLNLSKGVLLSCAGTVLPPRSTVLELVEDIEVDADVIEACRALHGLGYAIALDDFSKGTAAEALLPYVQYVKVDVLGTPAAVRAELPKQFKARGIRMIAEKVETAEIAHAVRAEGYDLLQGYFFCKPATLSARTIPARRLAYLELLSALNRPNLTMDRLESLIKHDTSLSYRVLRCVNSAAFGMQREIHSVRQAVVLLGLDQIKKWASVWALAGVNA